MLSTSTIKKLLNYSISIILLVWISVMIYKQVNHQEQLQNVIHLLKEKWSYNQKQLLFFASILMLVNWSIEAIKWQLLLKQLQVISFGRSLRSVFTGISISLLTPNRIGEYAGRIIYLKDVNKIKGVSANIIGSFAQYIAASVFGIFGCIYYCGYQTYNWYLPYILFASILLLILLSILYFSLGKFLIWLQQFTLLQKAMQYIEIIKSYNKKLLIKLILLSASRYIIFAIQYYIMLQFFQINIAILPAMLSIFLIFWLMAIIPSIALTEIPMRTEVSYQILKVFSTNAIGIMSSSLILWLLNLIIPACIGALVLLGAKFSSK